MAIAQIQQEDFNFKTLLNISREAAGTAYVYHLRVCVTTIAHNKFGALLRSSFFCNFPDLFEAIFRTLELFFTIFGYRWNSSLVHIVSLISECDMAFLYLFAICLLCPVLPLIKPQNYRDKKIQVIADKIFFPLLFFVRAPRKNTLMILWKYPT